MPDRPDRDKNRAGAASDASDASEDAGRAPTLSSDPGAPSLPLPVSGAGPTAVEPAGVVRRGGPRAVRAGDVLGRYELIEDVGEGGMATVYRARDRELRRDVAVKVLFPHLARRIEVVRRFDREARAAAGLEHENILRIYDVGGGDEGAAGDQHDPPYIVMELIRGSTLLGEIEQRGAILAEIVACVGALLADALAAAHAKGIIHRDIKPANILIAPGGRLLLADFGVARLETEGESLVTKTGALLGTPAYMSPEQASGDIATSKSDLYSIGATLYQLATGSLPYSGSPAKVLSLIASGSLVAPVRKRSSVGPDLSRLIEQLMASDPSARPASATIVATELRALAAAGGMGDATTELAAYFADPEGFLRERTPHVVTTIVTAANRAVAEQRLPRAMALADRASALAPDDPTVTALISTVTEGGRASQRRRIAGFAALGVVALGGVVAAGAGLGVFGGSSTGTTIPDAVIAAIAVDAPLDGQLVVVAPDPIDAQPAIMPLIDAAPLADARLKADAAVTPRRPDAGLDAGEAAVDAPVVPIDAAITIDAPAARGTITVVNDVWCEIAIDGVSKGTDSRNKPIVVDPGHHVVTCEQKGTDKRWTQEVNVGPGENRRVEGRLLDQIEVTIALTSGTEVLLNESRYRTGKVARIKAGRYRITIGGTSGYLDLRKSCTLKDTTTCL